MLARCQELSVNLTTRASHSALTSTFCANFFTRATDFTDKEELLVSYKKSRWNLISEKKNLIVSQISNLQRLYCLRTGIVKLSSLTDGQTTRT